MTRLVRPRRRVSLAGLLTAALLATPLIALTTPAAAEPVRPGKDLGVTGQLIHAE